MKTTLTQSDFISAFKNSTERQNQFSYSALCALFEYYGELERESETEIEFDMISICCDWTEYKTSLEAAQVYGFTEITLSEKTQVLNLENGSVLVLNF